MWSESTSVFLLVAVTAALMASNRIRFDIIALLVMLALMLSGILTVGEALAGFGSPVVILVAGLLVLGEMLDRTGVAAALGDWILKRGGTSETRLLVVIMVAAGILGAVMSSTAIVAIFIPIVLRVAAETNLQASRLLMPVSYAALISGMLTLIATTPNLVVSEELKYAGYGEFGFFSFTPVGLVVLAVAVVYFLLLGRRLLPRPPADTPKPQGSRSLLEIWQDYSSERTYRSLTISVDSSLCGQSVMDTGLENRFSLKILSLLREHGGVQERILPPPPTHVLASGDTLILVATETEFQRLENELGLALSVPSEQNFQHWLWELGGATMLVHPESGLVGKPLGQSGLQSRYDIEVLGVRRDGQPVADFESVELAPADSLFVLGRWSRIRQLASQRHDFVLMETPVELDQVVPAYQRRPIALCILAAMVLLSAFEIVPLVAAVIMAALAAGVSRCLTMADAYGAIHWSSLVLVAGMLPLADALEKTGGTAIIVDGLMYAVGDAGPGMMLTVLFFLTATLGLFLSNTASAVLVAPIAIFAAQSLGVSPYPFAVAVLIAASAAFVTPVSTPVVTLVVEPGSYAFIDFVKVGAPLLILVWLVTLWVTPWFFPYGV